MPPASVVIPTRERAGYLAVALDSVLPQARDAGAEVLVVLDGPDAASEAVARERDVPVVAHDAPFGLNAARNTGIAHTTGELVAFVDDDVEVRPGWLEALLGAAREHPGADVFTGPVFARFEDHPFRTCGREGPPITFLDLGAVDTDAPHAWGANLAVRRSAFERVGLFDPARALYGDEQEWLDRCAGPARYVATAALDHRRAGDDARLGALARAAYRRGQASRRFDVFKGAPPSLARELRTLAGTVAHGPRFACMNGPVLAAHQAGRLHAALRAIPDPQAPDYLSGRSGTVGGRRQRLRAAADAALDVLDAPVRALLATRRAAPRRVLVLSLVRPEHTATWHAAERELYASHHDVTIVRGAIGARGKFENLNALLAEHPPEDYDWLLVVDDDVALPPRFLDHFLLVAERCDLRLPQPAARLGRPGARAAPPPRPLPLPRGPRLRVPGPVPGLHPAALT